MKKRYFEVKHANAIRNGGGQVETMIVEFNDLTTTGEYLRAQGRSILECNEAHWANK